VEPLSSDEEIVSFIKELGYKGDIKSITEVVTDHMHQPWRTFAANADYVGTTLKGLHVPDRQQKHGVARKENMPYPRFTKATSITSCPKIKMTHLKMRNSPAYKTFLAYATGAILPKKARKFKKPASPSKKKTLVVVEETAEKHAKKPVAIRQSAGVQIIDTPGVSVLKKKAPAKAERSKGIELLSKAALLEEAQLKKAIQRSKQETDIHQAGGSSEGAGLKPEVPDEPKGKSIDTSERTGLKLGVPDVSKADSSKSECESWGDSDDNDDDDQQSDDEQTESDNPRSSDDEEETQEDEFVLTPENYVPTDDESNDVNDEEYDRINEEMYSDVNVALKVTELEGEGKDDEEITDTGHVDDEHENVNQEVAGDQVKDDAQATVIAAHATQKTKVPLPSSSISSDYATKFLNFDNTPLADTEIIAMMEIKVQYEDPSIQTSPLLTVPVLVIPESSITPATTISLPIRPFIPLPQQSTPIPTTTTIKATTSTPAVQESETLNVIHLRVSDLEKEVKELKDVDHSLALLATIKSEVPTAVKSTLKQVWTMLFISAEDIRKVKMEHATKQQEFIRQKSQVHGSISCLMESILEDEDAMDKGVVDKLKKIKPDDTDRDEDPPARPDQGLKRKKMSKNDEPSKKVNSTETSKGTTKSQPKSIAKSAQVEEIVFEAGDTQVPHNLGEDMGNTDEPPIFNADPKDWFKKLKRNLTPDPEWNKCKTIDNKPTQKWLSDLVKAEEPSKTFDDLMSTLIDFSAFAMNRLQISDLTQEILVGPVYKLLKGTCDRYPFDLSKPLPLVQSRNCQIVPVDYFFNNDLAYLQGGSTGRTYATSLTKTKATQYDLQGIEDMRFYEYASNRVSTHDVYSTKRILVVTNVKVNKWYGYGHLEEIEVRRSDQQLYKFMEGEFPRLHLNDIEDMLLLVVQNRLFNLDGDVIVHLDAALRMFTRRIVIQKRVEDLQLGVESYQKKLNISRPLMQKAGITDLEPYTTYSNPQCVIYLDKLERNRLMCSHELYKFSDGTLISVRYKLKDMANNLEMGYTSVMPRRKWSNLDKKRSCIMVKDIDRQLLERRLIGSLEKFVGSRDYVEDLTLLQRTI
ncbi:hypothetical protein Tco_1130399, partial [Tanacetum coccineum]